MSRPLAYWHCGGDVVANCGFVIGSADIAALRDTYRDEARAAAAAGDASARRAASRLGLELLRAAGAAARWRRAGGGWAQPDGRAE